MPDPEKPKVIPNPSSGVTNIVLPGKVSAHVEVHPDPGTGEAPVIVESDPTPQLPERRKSPAPMQVNVSPQTNAGLPGIWGVVGNMGAVTFVMGLCFLMFMYLQKQHDASIQILREELKTSREMSMDTYQSLRDEVRQGRDLQAKSIEAFVIAAGAFKEGTASLTTEMRTVGAKLDKIISGMKNEEHP